MTAGTAGAASARRRESRVARKVAILEASARARADLSVQFAPIRNAQARAEHAIAWAATWLRRPVVIGAFVAAVVVLGPARLIRAARWGVRLAIARPLLAQALPALGERLLAAWSARSARSGRATRAAPPAA